MKVRHLRKVRQNMVGFYDTKSWRCPSDGYDPFTGRQYRVTTMRIRIGTGGRVAPWKDRI